MWGLGRAPPERPPPGGASAGSLGGPDRVSPNFEHSLPGSQLPGAPSGPIGPPRLGFVSCCGLGRPAACERSGLLAALPLGRFGVSTEMSSSVLVGGGGAPLPTSPQGPATLSRGTPQRRRCPPPPRSCRWHQQLPHRLSPAGAGAAARGDLAGLSKDLCAGLVSAGHLLSGGGQGPFPWGKLESGRGSASASLGVSRSFLSP